MRVAKKRLDHAFALLMAELFTDLKQFCGPQFFLQLLYTVGTFGCANLLSANGFSGVSKLVPLTFVASSCFLPATGAGTSPTLSTAPWT
jgi:hypothetical protein